MHLSEEQKIKVSLHIAKRFRCGFNFNWTELKKGYSNKKWLIELSDGTPLAIVKYYLDDPVLSARDRYENEKHALELFGKSFSPEILYSEPNIIVYAFIPGLELHNTTNAGSYKSKIRDALEILHSHKPDYDALANVITFYEKLVKHYKRIGDPSDTKVNDLEKAVEKTVELLSSNQDAITYIHGDLVPANILLQGDIVSFIDWEYFRLDHKEFDRVYFNYYAERHNLGIRLTSSDSDQEIEQNYKNLVTVLDHLWWKYCAPTS